MPVKKTINGKFSFISVPQGAKNITLTGETLTYEYEGRQKKKTVRGAKRLFGVAKELTAVTWSAVVDRTSEGFKNYFGGGPLQSAAASGLSLVKSLFGNLPYNIIVIKL